MRHLKLFPKIFLYTLGILLFIVLITHGLIYLLAPQIYFEITAGHNTPKVLAVSIDRTKFVAEAVIKALPFSLSCSLIICILCSLLFSRAITGPIRKITLSTEQMMKLDHSANCPLSSKDEIGILAQNVNSLYTSLLSTIEYLEQEKDAVRDMERARADFLRAASHELKTPVTALSAILENMILGVGKYQDYASCLPECKEIVENLSDMIREILETSRLNSTAEPPKLIDISRLLTKLCEPYQMIAAAHQISFFLNFPEQFSTTLSENLFSKAISNVLANAVAYTASGKTVSVYMDGSRLVIENECDPVPAEEIPRLFKPFYRLDTYQSQKHDGNGLGLYIVDTLLTSMNISYTFAPMPSLPGMRFIIQL